MIRLVDGENLFNYRVAGVAIRENSVLLQQAEGDNFWVLPGGRAEFGEPAEQTLIREMKEEIDVEVELVRLLWFVENFFTYSGKQYHEIALYFLMRLPGNSKYLIDTGPFEGEDGGVRIMFQWFPMRPEVLSSLPLLPGFLQTALQELPETVGHIVQRDS
jgi:ADP-ribose pyrophosphatase YjhB (NUDIX family)